MFEYMYLVRQGTIKTNVINILSETENGVLSFSELYDNLDEKELSRIGLMYMLDDLKDHGIVRVYNCDSEDEPAYSLTKKGKAVAG